MKYAYLLINFLTVVFPVLLSFDKRVAFYKTWKFIWPGMAITGLVFLFWDVLFTIKGVWSFNPEYITGIKFFELPLEEILFFLTVPFSCIFIYACLNHYITWSLSQVVSKWISNLIILISLIMIGVYPDRLYTLVTFGLLLPLIFTLQYGFKAPWLNRFYMAYVVSLLPFYIVNGILTAVPIVLYNNAENMTRRVGTIPVEDHFYSLALLVMNVGFFEYFKNKHQAKKYMNGLTSYTRSQLALRNGQDKPEIWVAYLGIIYDVTASRLWLKGKHYEHWAGQDLTEELSEAPHTQEVFERFKAVGMLK